MRVGTSIVLAVVLVSCSSGGGNAGPTAATATSADATAAVESATTPRSDDTPAETIDSDTAPTTTTEVTAAGTSTTPAPTTTEAEPTELADLDSLAMITIITPTDGNGPRPLLEWEPSTGAAGYLLTVSAPDDVAYWAWSGPEAEVWFGGTQEQPPDGSAGPTLFEPMELRVVAVDATGTIIAASRPTIINP